MCTDCFPKLRQGATRLSGCWWLFLAALLLSSSSSAVWAQRLPTGGTTNWEIHGAEEIVTFVLIDPNTVMERLPLGLQFLSAKDAQMPEVDEYLKSHPGHEDWVFSILEVTRQRDFILDGRRPKLNEGDGVGLWIAPVDPSGLAGLAPETLLDSVVSPSLGAVLVLGLWIPDREFAEYMRERGHVANYGQVTLRSDSTGTFQGDLRDGDLHIKVVATPRGEAVVDSTSGTQVLFAPEAAVEHVVVIAGAGGRHKDCVASWTKEGAHPISRGVFVGPTYLTTYDKPLRGSAYHFPRVDHDAAGK